MKYTCGYPVGAQYREVRFTSSDWLKKQLEIHISFSNWKIIVTKKNIVAKKSAIKHGIFKKNPSKLDFYIKRYILTNGSALIRDIIAHAFPDDSIINASKVIRNVEKLEKQGTLYKKGKFGHERYFLQMGEVE
jgi:hypothetical protein